MKATIVASAAFVGAVAAAAHNNHAGFHFRRNPSSDICTVYTTVYVYPSEIPTPVANSTIYATPSPIESSSTSCTEVKLTPTPEPPKDTYVPAPPPSTPEPEPTKEVYVPAPEPSKVEEPKPVPTKEAEKPTPKPSDTPSYGGGGRFPTNGDKWSITYTPYASNGQCKSEGEIKTDIEKIAKIGFTTIRSYSTDCGVFEYVVPQCQKHGLKVIYGIFLKKGYGPFSDYANEQLQDIIAHAPKDSMAMLIVGNESLFNEVCSPENLAKYIDYARDQLRGAGFPSDIPVTTTETVNIWEEKGAALCDHIDVFAVQIHPYFTPEVVAKEAGSFAAQQLEQASKVCPGAASKGAYITEIGWPTYGSPNGNAIPGKQEQKDAMYDVLEKVGTHACLFSYGNDGWKEPGAYGVEQYFGCADIL